MSNEDKNLTRSSLQAALLRHEDSLAPSGQQPGEDNLAVYRTLLETCALQGANSFIFAG